MAVAKVEFKRARAHIRYKLADGTVVPGTTTITGLLDKSGYLVPWANRLGLEGIDCNEYRDTLAGVGTLTHARILAELSGGPKAVPEGWQEYSPKEIDLSDNALIKFYEWQKTHDIETVFAEKPMVSEFYRYGGTIDWYGKLDGEWALADFKTGRAVYTDMVYQLAAYRKLIEVNAHTPPKTCRIVRIGRDETEGFEERIFGDLDTAWLVFEHLRAVYDLRRQIGG